MNATAKMLLQASLMLIVAPAISLTATPARSESLPSQQKLFWQGGDRNSILIADRSDDREDRIRRKIERYLEGIHDIDERRREVRRLRQDYRRLRRDRDLERDRYYNYPERDWDDRYNPKRDWDDRYNPKRDDYRRRP